MAFLGDIRRGARRGRGRLIPLPDLAALARQRRQLARLEDRALEDIGLSREEALEEASRPIWDVPGHWRR